MSAPDSSPRRGVVAVVLRGDRFLVIRRSRHVRAPGMHCFPGGTIEPGESEAEALCRELQEELALPASPLRQIWTSVTPWNVELAWWLAEIDAAALAVPNPLEVESFHWLTAALVIVLILLGLGAERMKDWISTYAALSVHKWFGMTVFVLTLARLAWRLGHRPPPLPETTPAWQRVLAHAVHWAFYVLLLGMPVLGYLLSSGGPYPLNWFALFDIPKAPVTKSLADAAHAAHNFGGIAMAALVTVQTMVSSTVALLSVLEEPTVGSLSPVHSMRTS